MIPSLLTMQIARRPPSVIQPGPSSHIRHAMHQEIGYLGLARLATEQDVHGSGQINARGGICRHRPGACLYVGGLPHSAHPPMKRRAVCVCVCVRVWWVRMCVGVRVSTARLSSAERQLKQRLCAVSRCWHCLLSQPAGRRSQWPVGRGNPSPPLPPPPQSGSRDFSGEPEVDPGHIFPWPCRVGAQASLGTAVRTEGLSISFSRRHRVHAADTQIMCAYTSWCTAGCILLG